MEQNIIDKVSKKYEKSIKEQLNQTGSTKKKGTSSKKTQNEIKENTRYVQQHGKAIENMLHHYELWEKAENKQSQSAKRNQLEMLKWHNVAEAVG